MTAPLVPLITTVVPIAVHLETATIRILSQSVRPSPLVVPNAIRTGQSLSAANRFPSAAAAGARAAFRFPE
ncbi:MAG TPA: hypothetical protein VJO33_05165, partial [Gemmatimonadaceae bacterium]|nr:hypothetical protein [Gemmatimonadaceae bacterium]